MATRRAFGVLTAFALVVATCPVVAAAPPEAEQAKETAYQAYGVSDYDTAIAEYKKAYRLTSDARLFYNLGLSHRKRYQLKGERADAVEARDYFHRFVELLDPSEPEHAAERERLEQMRALARTYIAELANELARRPPLETEQRGEPTHGRWRNILLITAGAFAITGGVTGVLALKYQGDANDANFTGDVDVARSDGNAANRFALATDVLLGAAIVSGGIGLYLAVSGSSSSKRRDRVTFSASPAGAALTVRY
jgi:tetratricopeptide (TPR) repeat protein